MLTSGSSDEAVGSFLILAAFLVPPPVLFLFFSLAGAFLAGGIWGWKGTVYETEAERQITNSNMKIAKNRHGFENVANSEQSGECLHG